MIRMARYIATIAALALLFAADNGSWLTVLFVLVVIIAWTFVEVAEANTTR